MKENKQIFNFATWWRQFSGQSIKIAFSTTFRPLIMRHQVAKLSICFIEASLYLLLYHIQKYNFEHLYPSGASQKICGENPYNFFTDSFQSAANIQNQMLGILQFVFIKKYIKKCFCLGEHPSCKRVSLYFACLEVFICDRIRPRI